MALFRRWYRNASQSATDTLRRAKAGVAGQKTQDLNRRLVSRMASRRFPSLKQWKYLFEVLTVGERQLFKIAAGVTAAALLVVFGRVWVLHVVLVPVPGGDYTEAIVGAPALPNPLFAMANDVDADLVHLMYAGLMTTTADGRIVPDLADSVEISDDGTEYVFHLKDNLVWHDGQKLTVDDVLFTYDLIQNSEYKSPLFASFRDIKIERVDDVTLKVRVSTPATTLLSTLTVGILPAHVWQDVPPKGVTLADYNLKPIGAGPYKFTSLTRDRLGGIRSYTMERFADAATPSLLDRVTFRFYPDMESAVTAVVQKQADGIAFVPLEFRTKLDARRDINKYSLRLPQYTAVFLNQKNQPVFQDPVVRAALVAATPRSRLVEEVLHGEGEPVESPLVPGMLGTNAATSTQQTYDPAAAQAMLEKAGYLLDTATSTVRVKKPSKKTVGTGKNAKVVVDGKTSTLEITLTTVDRPENTEAARILADAWHAVGFEVLVVTVPTNSLQKDVLRNHAYQALLFGEVLGADPDPYPFWHSSQVGENGLNLALYANREVDALLERARTATTTESRVIDYQRFATKIVADAPAIFLYTPHYPYFLKNSLGGVNIDVVATPADRFSGIRDWFASKGRRWRW